MKAEIIWHHSQTEETQIWFMNGARVASRATVLGETGQPTFIGPPFSIVGVGDFHKDGNADILWHNSQTHETQLWFMNGARVASRATVLGETGQPTFIGPPFSIVGVGDFNRDGNADILWHNAQTQETQIWFMNGARVASRATVLGDTGQPTFIGPPFSIVGVGDFNRDGNADILWHNAQTQETQIWFMNGAKVASRATVLGETGQPTFIGPPFSIVGVGDFNSDGNADILWHNAQTQETQIWFMNGARVASRATVLGETGQPTFIGPPFSIVGVSSVTTLHVNTGRICDYLDPPGTPQIGFRSYLINSHPRGVKASWRLSGTVNGVQPAGMLTSVQKAFELWRTAVPALGFTRVTDAFELVDITIGVGDLGPVDSAGNALLGNTQLTSQITINNNPTVTFVPQLPGGNSLLGVVAHEIGHAIGIGHSTTPGTLMYPFSSVTETLAPEDIEAVRALYGWGSQRAVADVGTEASPALCVCGPVLVMAWRGVGDDDRIWNSRTTDGVNWSPQSVIPGAASTDGPALAWDGATLWLAIRGVPDDDALYWATSSDLGDHWSNVTAIPGTGSTCAPSLTVVGSAPLMVWRGIPDDDALYYSTWHKPWATQQRIGGAGSADRPSVCVGLDNLPRIVWRGIPGDDSLYTSSLVGQFWQPQQQLSWVIAGNGPQGTVGIGVPGSIVGPSVVNTGDGRLFLAWQGVSGDDGIYFTQAAIGPAGQLEWSSQASLGIGTSQRPAIVSFRGLPFIAWKGVQDDHNIYTITQITS